MNDVDRIDAYITDQPEWQRQNLEWFRSLVHATEPTIEEQWKWMVPVFLVDGKLVCAMSTFKDHTKFNFFDGAALHDEGKLFNSGLDSKRHRSINLEDGDKHSDKAVSKLIEQAVVFARR